MSKDTDEYIKDLEERYYSMEQKLERAEEETDFWQSNFFHALDRIKAYVKEHDYYDHSVKRISCDTKYIDQIISLIAYDAGIEHGNVLKKYWGKDV